VKSAVTPKSPYGESSPIMTHNALTHTRVLNDVDVLAVAFYNPVLQQWKFGFQEATIETSWITKYI
jgi:hypothetical protein